MAVQLIPMIKAVAPYIAQVASSAIPAFISNPEAAKADPIMARQIEELQALSPKTPNRFTFSLKKCSMPYRDLKTLPRRHKSGQPRTKSYWNRS